MENEKRIAGFGLAIAAILVMSCGEKAPEKNFQRSTVIEKPDDGLPKYHQKKDKTTTEDSADKANETASEKSDTSLRNPNFDYNRYKPITLAQLYDTTALFFENEPTGIYITGVDWSIQQEVTYTGEFRKVSPERLGMITIVFRSISGYNVLEGRVNTEIKVIEDGLDYWLFVQDVLVPTFRNELEPGDKVTLYSIWIGANIMPNKKYDRILLVNEFWKGGS